MQVSKAYLSWMNYEYALNAMNDYNYALNCKLVELNYIAIVKYSGWTVGLIHF